MIAIARYLNDLDMGMYHRPYFLFLFAFKISVLPLRMLISLLSKIATQSSSHSWSKEIIEALCKPSKMCTFFAWELRMLDIGVFPVLVVLLVSFFGNWNVVPSLVFLHL